LIENNESVHKFLEWFSLACHMSPEKLVFWILEWVVLKRKFYSSLVALDMGWIEPCLEECSRQRRR
jgi:uncharacterized membrane protein YhdT